MSRPPLAYCTNVHAGPDLDRAVANLDRHALEVKRRHSPDAPMGVGLWLAAEGARQCLRDGRVGWLRDWLAERGLVPFTFNGFPYGDFHQRVVKHAVYLPAWWQPERLDYTLDLIAILDGVLPPGMTGSLSTLPVAWGKVQASADLLPRAGQNLVAVADHLARLEQRTGRLVHLCIEPEPGCVLDTAADVVAFFERHLLPQGDERRVRRHLRVCHDVCHAAVMCEEQADVLRTYRSAGIAVGKVQVSAAVGLDLGPMTQAERGEALVQLKGFVEERYLHQTTVRPSPGSAPAFFEDLPAALAAPLGAEYRTHFHVPIYLSRFGRLDALQRPILDCLAALRPGECEHFEAETYAWGVLPPELRVGVLAEGIAREMDWLRAAMPLGML
ncbi:MAG: metabolite traffic protein EboE [Gemmataceae bacterium]